MNNRYFFDKRDMKHFFVKYGLIILVALPIIILTNFAIQKSNPTQRFVLIDLAILCGVWGLAELLLKLIAHIKAKKQNTNDNDKE